MKKLFLAATALALFSLSACNKFKDFWDDHNDHNDHKDYKIVRWERDLSDPNDYTGSVGNFTYDSHNNPTSVVFDRSTTGDNGTNWKFTYDNQNRLATCWMYYWNDERDFHYMFKYVYGNNGRIVSDTTFFFNGDIPPNTDPSASTNSYELTHYTYDSEGRIIKEVKAIPAPGVPGGVPDRIFEYSYDANGNRVAPGVTYDNKVNFMRTHKVWMFINRNYSKNNPITAVSYNNAKLPKKFDANHIPIGFLNRVFNHSTFIYEKVD